MVIQFQRLSASDYLGCFKDDVEHPGFRFIPSDLDPAHVTPLTCMHACSTRYQYAAFAGKRVCLCGNVINSTMKVDDGFCSEKCTMSHDNHVCDHVTYYDVYWREQGIVGLILNIDERVELFSKTWFNAKVLGLFRVEFRYKIDGETISSWSNSSTLSHIFMGKGEHMIEVTARNNFSRQTTVVQTVNVVDTFQNVQFQCPAASVPGNEIVCRGEWRAGSGTVQFRYGDGLSENVYFDIPVNVHNEFNQTQPGLPETMNSSLATYVITTALNPQAGEVSHWAVVAEKPGRIRVQILRPYCNATERFSQDLCLSKLNNSNNNLDITTCNIDETYCLTCWRQCTPSDSAQDTPYYFATPRYNTTGVGYEVISEDVVYIPSIGYHIFPSTKVLTFQRNDVIAWSSDGGQLRYIEDETQTTLEYPAIGQTGTKLQANGYTKMHFGAHALTAYIRQPLKFELYHTYQKPGVYHITSPETPTLSITVDCPITPFTINVPKVSQTNSTVFLTTGLHNGTGVTYSWNFGDNSTVNSLKSSTTHVYTYPGQYLITLYASNSLSKFAVNASIEILEPIRGCHIQPIRAIDLGKAIILKWHCAFGSNVTFSVNFDDGHIAEFRPVSDNFIGNNLSHTYTSAGHYEIKIVVSSPLGTNVSLTEHVLVEIPVQGLEVRLLNMGHAEVLYIATSSEVSVERVLARGTHVMCTFNFGDEMSVTSAELTVNHTYRKPGSYHVNITCYNHVSFTWTVLNTSMIVEDVSPLQNLTLNVNATIFGETSTFEFVIPYGNFFSCEWDLGDNTTYTTSYPQVKSIIPHHYREVGTYNVFVTCRNELGKDSVTARVEVDEPIGNVSLMNPSSFVPVNQSVTFTLKLSKGSRVKYCIDCNGRYLYLGSNVTIATITHAYTTAGQYSVIVHLWNSVSSTTVTARRPLTVQYPVTDIEIFTAQPKRCPSLRVAVCLNLTKNTHPPSNASVLIRHGDNSSQILIITDFKSQMCLGNHEYASPGVYNITTNISNHISSQNLVLGVKIQNHPLSGISASYKNGSVFHNGLGPNNRYFPATKVIKLKIEENRDDVGYDWKIGNESLGDKRVIQKVFPNSGCHNVTVVVKSSSLDEKCFRRVCIEETLDDLNLNVIQPTYFKDPTMFTFSIKNDNIPSCFRLDLGDNTSVTFGPSACGSDYQNLSSYTHAYEQRGNYTVTLTRWNHVSTITRSVEVFIWDEACENVGVNITGGGFKDRPTIVRGSGVLVLHAHVNHKCHVAKMVFIHWSVFEWEFGGDCPQVVSDLREIMIYKNSSDYLTNELSIAGSNFGTGIYVVRVTVGFIGIDRDLRNITGSNHTWFEVSRPSLIARIKGGISRSVPWNEKFVLDGSGSRNLGNIPAKLHFSWLCRLATYPMAINMSSGCSHNGSSVMGNTLVLVLDSGNLHPNQEYVFSLEVREGIRKSYAQQNVFVLDGPVPSLDLRCIVNCKETINPSKRLLLESKCLNCQTDTRLYYQWSIYICNGTIHSCQELPDFQTKTSTGLQGANIATKENVLEIGATYRVRCRAWRLGSANAGYVDYLLNVNSPPKNGHCSVKPEQGFALETLFNVFCSGWWDKDKPLSYLIEVQNDDYQTYLASGTQSSVSIYLPVGSAERNFSLGVIVKVADGRLFSTTILHSVKVFPPTTVNYSRVIDDVQRAADSRANDEVFGLVLSLCSVMNNNLNASRQHFTAQSEVRLEVGRILAATNTTELKHVRGISDAFEALTSKPDQISLELQNEVTETIQRTNPVIESLANTSHDIRVVGDSLHRVLSNVVGAVLLTSGNVVTMGTNTSTNNTVTFADMKAQSIQNTFQTIDEVNNVLLQQVLAGDQSTIIKTDNYDISLAKGSIEDLIKNNQGTGTKFPLEFQDSSRLVENTNFTERNVLGVTVTDLSKTPSNLYDTTAEEINSNILRINVKDFFGQPVDMSDIGLSIFVKSPPQDHKADEFFVIHTRNSYKIHRFNRTTSDAALVLIFSVVDPNLSLRAFLSVGQRPTLKKYSLKTEFTANNLTSGHYTWVVSRDVLRNITQSPESHGYFLGVSWSGGMGLGNMNYSLHVAWVKCLLLEEGGGTWTSAGCEVGSLTSLERTHCICRPGQTDRFRRLTRSTEFSRKKTFKIAVGAGVFPTPNKINFHYVFDADISNNPLALIAVSTVFGIYLILIVCGRRRDRKDSDKIGVTALPSNKLSDKYFYEVIIYTGSVYDAGTSAHVSITLRGTEGDLGPRLLHDPMRQCFQRSAIDTFLISSRDPVGDVSYLQIWHDNTGAAPSWFLDKIVVRDLNDKKSCIFYNETWLAVENNEGGIQKLLFSACKDEITQFKRLFNSTIHSNLKDRHLWFSLFSRPVDSRFTLVQRLSCCLSLLYTTMLANAMFYQETEASSPESCLIIGPFMFGLRELGVGVMSALIIVPINAGIVWIFRNVEAKPCKEELGTRREQTRLWWFFELFFCCFKSRLYPSSLTTRKASDYFYSDGVDVRDKVPRSHSENSLRNQDVPVEISNDAVKLSKKPKGSSTSIQLPYWYIYVAWSLVCLTCVVSVFFVVLYGLQFGKVVSYQWLSSMTVSFVQDVLISEPLKVFSIAVVVALIIKKPQNSEHENEDYERTIVDHHTLQNTDDLESKVDDYSDTFHSQPPDRKDLEMARNKRLKELRTGALLRELCLYVLFLFCLSAVTYKNKNPMSFQVYKTMRDLLVEPNNATVGFEQISTMKDFLTWINGTFVDALCFSPNKPRYSSDETNTVFGHFYLVGSVRLYQTRHGEVSSTNHTKKPLFMDMNCLNRTVSDQNRFTKINNWLNTRTREINIKFNVYNPEHNLFCLAKLTVDILPTNGMETRANFVVTKLFAVTGIFDTLTVVSHVFVFLFFLAFTYRELKQVYLWRKEYFKNFWSILQGILVLLILSCIVVFFLRLAMVEELLRNLAKNDKHFIHFDTVVFVDNILANLIAFLVFLSWLRATRFLRFNRRLSFLQDTLGKIAKPLATYSVVFLTVFFAYVHSGYLLFSRDLEIFSNLRSTFTALCSLFMGHFDFPSLQNSNRIIGPLFVFSALFFGGFIIINMLIALILESFLAVKTASRANQYELLEYIKKHLRYWFGTTEEYTPQRAVLRDSTPGKNILRDSTLGENTLRDLITSHTTLRETSVCEDGLIPQDSNSSKRNDSNSSLAGIERSVSGLMTSLECVCAEDWHEEVVLYRLSLKSLGLACYEWLGYASDSENRQDLEVDLLRNELYDAVEKYSQELTDRDQNSEKLVSSCEEGTFSTFDLNFEEESF